MKMLAKMMFEPNDVKIYDVVAHKSFTINRKDINVTETIKRGRPNRNRNWNDARPVVRCLVFTHSWANKKTPNYEGRFAVSDKTYEKITTVPRKDWTKSP